MKKPIRVLLGILACVALALPAVANDQIFSTVTNGAITEPQAVIVENGVPQGTIQLWYTYTGNTFPCGQFATFNLSLLDKIGSSGKAPTYPVELDLVQSGHGTPVQFSPSIPSFSVAGVGWTGSTPVTVNIDCSQLGTPYDGEDIVGNLNEQTNPQGAHLDTISTIQVHIRLMYPTGSCLRLYSFETDGDGNILNAITVVAPKGKVKASNPGEVWVDGMLANTCPSSESFDMLINIGDDWLLNPGNNPGNATFTYDTAGDIDPTLFSLSLFGTGTKQGETLCLKNVTVASGDTFLATEHTQIVSGGAATSLDNYGSTPQTFNSFLATLFTANTGCSGTALGSVSPNPAPSTLNYTVQ